MEPQLRLSSDHLDIGDVFLGLTQSYEVVLWNAGAIDAAFSLVPPSTALGCFFTFLPTEGMVSLHSYQVIRISFSAAILGRFTETFMFRVYGSPEPLTLAVRGCVVRSPFHFDVPSLNFGDVSLGFPRTLSCRLINTSLVPRTVNLRILGDGLGEPSVTSSALMADSTHWAWTRGAQGRFKPTEFTITPRGGTIPAQGSLNIQVTLCSNTVESYKMELAVDMAGVEKKVLALPLTARCVVPRLQVLNPALMFGNCSLNIPYRRVLTLVNNSDLPGCYRVLPQEHKDAAAVLYYSPRPCGIIQPRSSVEVPFILQAQVVGKQDTVVRVVMFGNEGSPLEIHLVSFGKGPVVHVQPNTINSGSIQDLQNSSQALHLSNKTVGPASSRAEMVGKHVREGTRRKLPGIVKRRSDILTALPSAGGPSPKRRVRFSPLVGVRLIPRKKDSNYRSTSLLLSRAPGLKASHLHQWRPQALPLRREQRSRAQTLAATSATGHHLTAPAGTVPTDTPKPMDVGPSYVLDISVPTDVEM